MRVDPTPLSDPVGGRQPWGMDELDPPRAPGFDHQLGGPPGVASLLSWIAAELSHLDRSGVLAPSRPSLECELSRPVRARASGLRVVH